MATPSAHEADISLLNTAIVEIKDTLKDLKELLLSNAVLSEQVSHFKENITDIDIRLRKLELDVAQGKGSNRCSRACGLVPDVSGVRVLFEGACDVLCLLR